MSTPLEHLQGKYEILEKLREGGMGAVYKVRHRLLDEVRVIKLIRPQYKGDEEMKARFVREARTAIKLRHPNIAQLYDFSIDADDNAFIVMEYIEGFTLEEVMRKVGVPPLALTLEVAIQTMQALGHLHRKGIVHRDVAPDNLMLTREDDGLPLIKLIDLGVAKALQGTTSFTVAGTFLGKVRYASPEQFRTQEGAVVDERSDLYSFGVVLYELLTGQHPIRGADLSSLIAGHLLDQPQDFSITDPDGRVPDDLRTVVTKLLAKAPADRYSSCDALAGALAKVQERYPVDRSVVEPLWHAKDVPTMRIPIVRPGSTQARLDENFQLVSTPAPPATTRSEGAAREAPPFPRAVSPAPAPPPESPPPRPRETTEAKRARHVVESMVDEARGLVDAGDEEGAVARLSEALAIAPENGEARTMHAALSRRIDERRAHDQAVAKVAQQAEQHLAEGRVDEGDKVITDAIALFGAHQAFTNMQDRISEARARDRRARAEILVAEARSAGEAGNDDGAAACARDALLLDADNEIARTVLAEAEKRIEKRREREEAIEAAIARATSHLEAGRLDHAEKTVTDAIEFLGEADSFARLQAAIGGARDQLRRSRVAALLGEARVCVEAERLSNAIELLREALQLSPDDAIVQKVLAETEERHRRVEEQRRVARELAEAEKHIGNLLQLGEIDTAGTQLQEAIAKFGECNTLVALRTQCDAMVAEKHAWDEVERRAQQARDLAHRLEFTRAFELLAEARPFAGEYAELGRFLDETETVLQRQAEGQRLAKGSADARARIAAYLERGDLAEAERALALAEKIYPNDATLRSLRGRLERAQIEGKAEKVAALLGQVRQLADQGGFEAAVALLREVRGVDPGNLEFDALEAELRRREAIAAIEANIERGDLVQARRALELAERMFPGEPAFRPLRRKLKPSGPAGH